MKFSGDYLYRVRVIEYPKGALTSVDADNEQLILTPGWHPPNWRPERNYVQIMGTDQFVWPVTNKVYGSRSTAKKRADLLASYGATVVIERSSPISWFDSDPVEVAPIEAAPVAKPMPLRPRENCRAVAFKPSKRVRTYTATGVETKI